MQKTFLAAGLVLVTGSAIAQDAATPSFTLSPVQVESEALPALKELDPVGASKQPTWTTAQRFSFSDVYVRPEGARTVGVTLATDAGFATRPGASDQLAETVEVGLGHGWQVSGAFLQDDVLDNVGFGGKFEVRKAIAPWGGIWGNPTLVASYTERERDNDILKAGALLGGNLADKWSWSFNAGYERSFQDHWTSVSDNSPNYTTHAAAFSGGVMYSIQDNVLAAGLEGAADVTYTHVTGANMTGSFVGVGPSVSWRPTVAGHKLNVRAAALLLNGYAGDRVTPHNHLSLGVSYGF